jgi:hypothetical protein
MTCPNRRTAVSPLRCLPHYRCRIIFLTPIVSASRWLTSIARRPRYIAYQRIWRSSGLSNFPETLDRVTVYVNLCVYRRKPYSQVSYHIFQAVLFLFERSLVHVRDDDWPILEAPAARRRGSVPSFCEQDNNVVDERRPMKARFRYRKNPQIPARARLANRSKATLNNDRTLRHTRANYTHCVWRHGNEADMMMRSYNGDMMMQRRGREKLSAPGYAPKGGRGWQQPGMDHSVASVTGWIARGERCG